MTGTNLHKGAMLKQAFGIASPQDYRDVYETLNDIGQISILDSIPSRIKIHIIKIPKTLLKESKRLMILIQLQDIL